MDIPKTVGNRWELHGCRDIVHMHIWGDIHRYAHALYPSQPCSRAYSHRYAHALYPVAM